MAFAGEGRLSALPPPWPSGVPCLTTARQANAGGAESSALPPSCRSPLEEALTLHTSPSKGDKPDMLEAAAGRQQPGKNGVGGGTQRVLKGEKREKADSEGERRQKTAAAKWWPAGKSTGREREGKIKWEQKKGGWKGKAERGAP